MSPKDFRRLVDAGLTSEQIEIVMEILSEQDEDRRAAQRARWRKHMEKKRNANVSKRELTLANVSGAKSPMKSQAGVREHAELKQLDSESNIGRKEEKKENAREARSGFDAFWVKYPNKVGKRDAAASFARALGRAPLETIMAGLDAYVSKTDDRPWCNPSTWLNQDRWTDQPAPPVPRHAKPQQQTFLDVIANDSAKTRDEYIRRAIEKNSRW